MSSICTKWKRDRSVNPRSNRRIKVDGPTYKKLQKECVPEELPLRQRRIKKSPKVVSNVCEKWSMNRTKNPRTGRTIKVNGPTYKKLLEECVEEKMMIPQDLLDVIEVDDETLLKMQQCEKIYVKKGRNSVGLRGVKKSVERSVRLSSKKSSKKKTPIIIEVEEKKSDSVPSVPSVPPIYKVGSNELQWDGHPTMKLTEMSPCLQDIIVNNYISSGSYGLVYRCIYNGKNCALKIIPIDNKIPPLKGVSSLRETREEYEFLDKIQRVLKGKNVAPEVYLYKTCQVKLPAELKNKTLNIAIMIIELLDYTLYQYCNKQEQKLIDSVGTDNFKQILNDTIGVLRKTDDKIRKDLIELHNIGIYNVDCHRSNIMFNFNGVPMISDLGLAETTKGRYTLLRPYEDSKQKYFFTIKFLEEVADRNELYLLQQEKDLMENYIEKFDTERFVLKQTKISSDGLPQVDQA